MKKITIFFLVSSGIIFAQQPAEQNLSNKCSNSNSLDAGDVNNMQRTSITINNQIIISMKQINKIVGVLKMRISMMFSNTKNKIDGMVSRSKGLINDTGTLISNHKYKLIAATAGLIYGYLFFQSWNAKNYIKKTTTWFSWKKDLTMEELLSIPQDELARQLISEIQKRYVNSDKPDDFLSPFTSFIKVSDKELTTLRKYLNLHEWITNLRLCRIFPLEKSTEIIKEKMQRLIYFQNLFSSWIASYKLDLNALKKCIRKSFSGSKNWTKRKGKYSKINQISEAVFLWLAGSDFNKYENQPFQFVKNVENVKEKEKEDDSLFKKEGDITCQTIQKEF